MIRRIPENALNLGMPKAVKQIDFKTNLITKFSNNCAARQENLVPLLLVTQETPTIMDLEIKDSLKSQNKTNMKYERIEQST